MKRNITYNLLVAAAIIVTACSDNESESPLKSGLSMLKIEILTDIENPDTRAAVKGSKFNDGNTIGLVITKHQNISTPFNIGSENICAQLNNNIWEYSNNGTSSTYPEIYIIQKDETDFDKADFYAYAPWTSVISDDFTSITYNLHNGGERIYDQPDIMWAKQNAGPEADNAYSSNFNVSTGAGEDNPEKTHMVNFSFQHKLAALVFRLEKSTGKPDGTPVVSSISIKPNDGSQIVKSVKLNIQTGQLVKISTSDQLKLFYNRSLNDSATELWMLIYPEDMTNLVSESVYDVSFTIDNCLLNQKYTIKKQDIQHSDGTYGFKSGNKYIFSFKVDNHVHFQGVSIDETWQDQPETEIKI